jgi:hypothetical protein
MNWAELNTGNADTDKELATAFNVIKEYFGCFILSGFLFDGRGFTHNSYSNEQERQSLKGLLQDHVRQYENPLLVEVDENFDDGVVSDG